MVFWVIAKGRAAAPPAVRPAPTERLGPFESHNLAARAREDAVRRQPPPPGVTLEIVCDFS